MENQDIRFLNISYELSAMTPFRWMPSVCIFFTLLKVWFAFLHFNSCLNCYKCKNIFCLPNNKRWNKLLAFLDSTYWWEFWIPHQKMEVGIKIAREYEYSLKYPLLFQLIVLIRLIAYVLHNKNKNLKCCV